MALSDKQKEALRVFEHGFPNLWKQHAEGKTADQITLQRDASKIIGLIKSEVELQSGGIWPWNYWTKQTVCAQALYECNGDANKAYDLLSPSLGKIKALKFTRNQNGKRVELPLTQQQEALKRQINAVKDEVRSKLAQKKGGDDLNQDQNNDDQQQEKKRKPHPWIQFVRQCREFCQKRKADGHELDEWGLRQAEYGAMLIKAGIPINALKHAATMHWPPEARRAVGVTDYDPTTFKPDERQEGKHAALPYILAVVKAGVPLAMIGPKGTGKTTLGKQIADILDRPFTLISMTSATSPSAFFGRPKIGGDGGVVESEFSKFCRTGGVILLDEMDAADENLLLIANSAIANRQFYNQQTAELIPVSDDTIFIAGMNTMGLGAGRDYNSRNKLDAATLDRWAMGRVQITLDERVEDAIFYGILNS